MRFGPTIVGILLVLVLCELPLPYPRLPRPVPEDRLDCAVVTIPFYNEGFSIAHFSQSGARLTANPVLSGAPYLVILGDSYVEALQVSDEQTMGSVLEREARRGGQPLNVRQYGWSGDSPAHYALIAEAVQHLWHPSLVCVILNFDDFTPSALKNYWAEMKLHADEPPTITPVDRGTRGLLRTMASALIRHSGLINAVAERGLLDILPTLLRTKDADKPSGDRGIYDSRIVDATITALDRAYGGSLLVVLVQNPGITGGHNHTQLENLLQRSCAMQNVDCITTREAFIDLRDRKQRFGFGFNNSLPQVGHINVDGHRLVAELIWADYQRRMAEGK
jgi:hypothetical protein